jgi:DNA-binding NarL/FixJ family response regulator
VLARVRETTLERRRGAFAGLTEQELRVLALVARGLSNKEVARVLGLREKTIRNYVSAILAKLGLASRVQAATYALRHHIEMIVALPEEL